MIGQKINFKEKRNLKYNKTKKEDIRKQKNYSSKIQYSQSQEFVTCNQRILKTS